MAQIVRMTSQEPIKQAERELAEVKGLVDEQYGLVMRLTQIGADTREAVRLLIDLLELQQTASNVWHKRKSTTGNVIGGSHCDFNRKSAAPLRKISGAPLPMDRGQLLLANTANLLAKPQRQND